MAATDSPSDLIDRARAQPVHSPARTNLILEAVALLLAEGQAPRPRAPRRNLKPEVPSTSDA